MDTAGVYIFLQVAPKYIHTKIDSISAINDIESFGFINKRQANTLRAKFARETLGCTVKDTFVNLLADLFQLITYDQAIVILRQMGCPAFADELEAKRGVKVLRQNRHNCKHLVNFHKQLKSFLDDNVYVNKQVCLEMLGHEQVDKISLSFNIEEKQLLVHNYSIIMWLRAQLFRDETTEQRMDVLEEMMKNIPNDVDHSIANLVVMTQTAVNFALLGDVNGSLAAVEQAKQFLSVCQEVFATTMACHDIQYVFRLLYAKTKDNQYLEHVMEECDRGLQSLFIVPDNEKMLLDRLFKLNMAQVLLAIQPKLDIDRSIECTPCQLVTAKLLVGQVKDKHFQGIEKRREMLYSLCNARIHELGGEKEKALAYATKATAILNDGTYFDSDFDKTASYQMCLHNQLLPMQSTQLNN